jgi:hypothetical protein
MGTFECPAGVSDAVTLAMHLDGAIQVDETVLDLATISDTRGSRRVRATAEEIDAFHGSRYRLPGDFDPD